MGPDFDDVLRRARAGSHDAVGALYRACHPPLHRYLRVREPSEADDVAADVWMAIARGIGAFEGDKRAFLAWMFTIARRRVIDVRRKRARRQTSPVADVPETADRAHFETSVAATDAVREMLAGLPQLQAEVVALRLVCDLSVDEVARILDRSPEAIRALQHRAMRRLAAEHRAKAVTA